MKIGLAICAIAVCASSAAYSQDHDYSITVITPAGQNSTFKEALIIDRRTGDLWDYIDQYQLGQTPGGTSIIYKGKITPGSVPGQVIIQHGFGKPAIPPNP